MYKHHIKNIFIKMVNKSRKGKSMSLMLIFSINIYSQQLPRFSQYMMDEFIINPSVAGSDGMTTINTIARKDWYNFGNDMRTPESLSFSVQSRILKSKLQIIRNNNRNKVKGKTKGRVGLGASIFTDNSGAMRRSSAQFTYAYHIVMNNTQLSFGISTTMSQIHFNRELLNFYNNGNEPMLALAQLPSWIPDFNAGINFMTHKYHVGFSVLQALQSPYIFGNPEIDYKSVNIGFKRSYNALGSLYITMPNADWDAEPSFLLKMYDLLNFKGGYNGPVSQLDLSLKMFYNNKYWFGASYRTLSEFIVMGGLKHNNYYFSYSFDYGFNELVTTTMGSHEISLSVKFGDSTRRYRWKERY